jgi:hypothetical protein
MHVLSSGSRGRSGRGPYRPPRWRWTLATGKPPPGRRHGRRSSRAWVTQRTLGIDSWGLRVQEGCVCAIGVAAWE